MRDELRRVVRRLAESGEWQGVTLCELAVQEPGAPVEEVALV